MGYVTFALRLVLGGILLVSGVLKAVDGPAANVAAVAGYQVLPAAAAAFLGVVLPYAEIAIGGYLIAGLFTRTAAYSAAAFSTMFAIAVASAVVRGLTISCGCFGANVTETPTWFHVAGDVLGAAAALVIARFAPGRYSLDDRQRKRIEAERRITTT